MKHRCDAKLAECVTNGCRRKCQEKVERTNSTCRGKDHARWKVEGVEETRCKKRNIPKTGKLVKWEEVRRRTPVETGESAGSGGE